MNLIRKQFLLQALMVLTLLCVFHQSAVGQNKKFTLVIDAGHGGHDPGAIGDISREKDINLGVSLKLGSLIEKNFRDVKIVYTRKTDKYLTLQERADVVNENHADLFICIHTNAAKSSAAYGAETFTLGLAKSKANLDVAMRENSVILLEDDYKSKYKGFDPSSVDSYIMFEFMQDKYLDKSLELAINIQKQFVGYSKRSDRGVRQAGFWVLHRSACPSVLIELGFISHPSEERFLASESGQNDLAISIYNAFTKFKHEHDKKSGIVGNPKQYEQISKSDIDNSASIEPVQKTSEVDNKNVIDTAFSTAKDDKKNQKKSDVDKKSDVPKTKNEVPANTQQVADVRKIENQDTNKPIFKVQIFASPTRLNSNAADFKGTKNVDFFQENGWFKYTVGSDTDYNKIVNIRKELLSKFPDAFIIAFVAGKKMPVNDALKLIN